MTFHHILQYKSISSLLRGGGALVSVVRLRAVMEDRRINFGAGPAALPMAVLERIQGELLNYQGALVRYKFVVISLHTNIISSSSINIVIRSLLSLSCDTSYSLCVQHRADISPHHEGSGCSVMELSHRSPHFADIIARAESSVRELLYVGPSQEWCLREVVVLL